MRRESPPRAGLFRRVFQNRDLALLWLGQTISMAGDSIYEKALLWVMLELTGSSGMTGLVALSAYLPTLLVGAWAGVAVDRLDRRRVMIAADAARAGLVLVLPALHAFGRLTPLSLFVVTFAVAMGAAFFNPARDAMVPHLVKDPAQLLRANALVQSSWMLALFLGPAAGIFLLQWLGAATTHLFYIDSATYLVSLVCVAFIALPARQKPPSHAQTRMWTAMVEGLRMAAGDRRVRWLLIITAFDNLFIMGPASVGIVIFTKQVLNRDITSLMLVEACYSVGMILGTALLGQWQRHFNKGRILLIGMILDGITFIPLVWIDTLWATALTIVIHSMAIPLLIVSRPALVQQIVPSDMQGRVFSLIGVTVVGLTAVSSGLTGLVVEFVPIEYVFGIIGLAAGLCGLWGWRVPELRES